MLKSLAVRSVFALVTVGGCALVAGCLSGNPSYFPYLLPAGDPAVQSHARPPGPGYFGNYDPHACRIVVRPELCTSPVRGTQVLIATVYDADGIPRRNRRVEWMVEGPGSIVEVDESGYLPGRGMKVDNKYAFSHTDYFENCITRGRDEFTVRPGQTWCVVTSAIEGETTVIAYCPAINDGEKNRAYVKVHWVEGNLLFPAPVTARAGGDYTLNTTLTSPAEKSAGYRVRYRILDGPAAALTAVHGGEVSSVTEAVAAIDKDGAGRVNITQPLPAAGTNRIGIEVVKPDPDQPGQFTLVSKGETRVTWQAPQLNVRVSAQKTIGLNQETTVTFAVGGSDKVDAGPVTLTIRLPDGIDPVSTEPKAAVDGDTLIWTLPAAKGKQQTVQAIVRPNRVGPATLTADARSEDGVTGRGSAAVSVAESRVLPRPDGPATNKDAQLALTAHGPARGYVGQEVMWQLVVRNTGDMPLSKVVLKVTLPPEVLFARATDGGKASGRQVVWELESAPAGQDRAVAVTGICNNVSSRTMLTATVSGSPLVERNGGPRPAKSEGQIESAEAALEIVGVAALQMSVKDSSDPIRVGQRTTYVVRVKNAGTQVAKAVVVTADILPKESMRAVRATGPGAAGKIDDGRVTFAALESLAPNAETTFVIEVEARTPGDARVRVEAKSPSQAQTLRAEEPTRINSR